MDYESILKSMPHDIRYLEAYIKWIKRCRRNTTGIKHHICPKSKDLWPQYKSFKTNSWNMSLMTPYQHLVAHWLLWKAYNTKSLTYAYYKMGKGKNTCLSVNSYNEINEAYRKIQSDKAKERLSAGTHNFQSEEHLRKISELTTARLKELGAAGLHQSQTPEAKAALSVRMSALQKELVATGNHHSQTKESKERVANMSRERAAQGLNNFQGEENQKVMQEKAADARKTLQNRPLVQEIFQYAKDNNIRELKFGRGWFLKSEDIILEKFEKLKNDRANTR
jgi:hypothetical protein